MPKNPASLNESVAQARQTADQLRSVLLQAHERAGALESLLLMPMVVEATRLLNELRALDAALNATE